MAGELEQIQALSKELTDTKTALQDAIKRQDELKGEWKSAAELTVKGLEEKLTAAEKARSELETRYNDRLDELETRFTRPGAAGEDAEAKAAQKAASEAFLKYVRKGDRALGPDDMKALVTDADDEGGYHVPEHMRLAMIEELVELSPLRAAAMVQTVSTGQGTRHVKDEGEFGAEWIGERETRAETATSEFSLVKNDLHELMAYPKVSLSMLEDGAMDVEGYLSRKVAERFSKKEGIAFLNGDGVMQPKGILQDAGTLDLETAVASTVDADDILNIIHEVPTSYARSGVLYTHRKGLLHMRKLKDDQGQYLWQPSLQARVPSTFGGVPVVEVPDMDSAVQTAGNKPYFFGNLRLAYEVVQKNAVSAIRDNVTQPGFVKFHFRERVGGRLILPEAVSVLEVKA